MIRRVASVIPRMALTGDRWHMLVCKGALEYAESRLLTLEAQFARSAELEVAQDLKSEILKSLAIILL